MLAWLCIVGVYLYILEGCSILIYILVHWPGPHPTCVSDGICHYFYSGMDHWPLQNGFFNWSGKNSKIKGINTTEHPPRIWRRYVDDKFVVQKAAHRQVPWAYRFQWPKFTIRNGGNKRRWVHAIPWHLDDARKCNTVWEAYSNRHTLAVGQPWQSGCKVKCH